MGSTLETLFQNNQTSTNIHQDESLWKPICEALDITNFEVRVSPGDGVTNIARKAVSQYFNNVTLSKLNATTPRLNAEENIYAEDYIRKRVAISNLSVKNSVLVPCSLVEEATLKARATTIAQKKNLEKYSGKVFEHQVDEIIQENLNKLYETNPDLKKNSGSLELGQ